MLKINQKKPQNIEDMPENQAYSTLSLSSGFGDKSFHIGKEGIWAGAEKFEDAPFSVTMAGVLTGGGQTSFNTGLFGTNGTFSITGIPFAPKRMLCFAQLYGNQTYVSTSNAIGIAQGAGVYQSCSYQYIGSPNPLGGQNTKIAHIWNSAGNSNGMTLNSFTSDGFNFTTAGDPTIQIWLTYILLPN